MAAPAVHQVTAEPRWFTWLHIIVWLSVVITFALAVLVPVQSYQIATGGGTSIATVPVSTEELRGARPVPRGWRIDGVTPTVDIPVTPTGPRVDLAVAYLVSALPLALVNMVALVMVARVMDTPALITDRVLFSGTTANRIRRVGWFVLVASIAIAIFEFVMWNVIRTTVLPSDVYPNVTSVMGVPTYQSPSLWFGLALLGLAEIIRRGHRMREDLEGVV
jgi:hypothetical protein